jgi:hypothetical protein
MLYLRRLWYGFINLVQGHVGVGGKMWVDRDLSNLCGGGERGQSLMVVT